MRLSAKRAYQVYHSPKRVKCLKEDQKESVEKGFLSIKKFGSQLKNRGELSKTAYFKCLIKNLLNIASLKQQY